MTCGKPIRDRAGEPLPGRACNLKVDANGWHLGACAEVLVEWYAVDHRNWTILDATVTPSEPSGSRDGKPGKP